MKSRFLCENAKYYAKSRFSCFFRAKPRFFRTEIAQNTCFGAFRYANHTFLCASGLANARRPSQNAWLCHSGGGKHVKMRMLGTEIRQNTYFGVFGYFRFRSPFWRSCARVLANLGERILCILWLQKIHDRRIIHLEKFIS